VGLCHETFHERIIFPILTLRGRWRTVVSISRPHPLRFQQGVFERGPLQETLQEPILSSLSKMEWPLVEPLEETFIGELS